MKKLRKLLSISTALLLTVASITSLNVSAIAGENYAKGTIETVAESFGKDAHVEYYYFGGSGPYAMIIEEDGSAHVFHEICRATYLTVAEGKTLPVDEINEKIAPYTVKYNLDTGYTLYVRSMEDQKKVYDILKSYDEVSSIDEKVDVYKTQDSCWAWSGILFESEEDADKAIELVPEMKLTKEAPSEDIVLWGSDKPGFVYLSEFIDCHAPKTLDKTIYDCMKKLSESGLKYEVYTAEKATVSENYSSGVFNIYTAENVKSAEITADYDNNGKADLTDLTALSLYLIGDATWNTEQVNNFDCNADGSTNLADLAHLKQYIMGEDVKLG